MSASAKWQPSPPAQAVANGAVRAVAVFEAAKGVAVLLAALAVLSLLHRNLHDVALALVERVHLDPAAKYPRLFLDAIDSLNASRLLWLALAAFAYATLRFVEAYGLFRQRTWAELLAAGSGAIYIPFELFEIFNHPNALHGALLLINVAVVAVMVRALRQQRCCH